MPSLSYAIWIQFLLFILLEHLDIKVLELTIQKCVQNHFKFASNPLFDSISMDIFLNGLCKQERKFFDIIKLNLGYFQACLDNFEQFLESRHYMYHKENCNKKYRLPAAMHSIKICRYLLRSEKHKN